jgi:hypothetical protein
MLDTTTIASGRMSKLMANFRHARRETPGPEMDKMSPEARRLLRLAGFLTWSLAGLPLFVRPFQTSTLLQQPRYQLCLACFFIFCVTFGHTPWNEGSARPRRVQLALPAVHAVTALVMLVLVCSGHEGALLVLVAAQLGWFMSLRRALLWVAIQAVLMGAIIALGCPLAEILSLMATYVAFQVLALFSCLLAASEAGARSGPARANRELRATGELLANTSRMAETRTNLARVARCPRASSDGSQPEFGSREPHGCGQYFGPDTEGAVGDEAAAIRRQRCRQRLEGRRFNRAHPGVENTRGRCSRAADPPRDRGRPVH